jgi:DNA-directed RNA polymerase subunit M/transcription elongation factor TFIIS
VGHLPKNAVFGLELSNSGGLLCLVGYFAVGVHKRCPSCEVLFARVTIDSEVLKQESGYETVTRRDQVRAKTDDVFSNIVEGGKHVGNIIRQEQVHVTHTTSRIYYKCSECGHRWSKLKVSTSQ